MHLLRKDKMEPENKQDTNKYDSVIPQAIEASGNLLQKSDKRFILILSIVFTINFLGYLFFSYCR